MRTKLWLLVVLLLHFSLAEAQVKLHPLQKEVENHQTQFKLPVSFQNIGSPDVETLLQEDKTRDKNGQFYRIAQVLSTNITPQNSGEWQTLDSGDKVWRVRIKAPNALALNVLMDKFVIYGSSYVQVLDTQGRFLSKKYTEKDVEDHQMGHIPMCKADDIVIELFQGKYDETPELFIDQIGYVYRGGEETKSYGESDNCQNDINAAGQDWQNEKRGVARILVKDSGFQGWCTGSLINNNNQDCKPYFLTAQHCGETSSAADFNQWIFHFNFEAENYNSEPLSGWSPQIDDNMITGCVKLASSNDVSGNNINGSDYILAQLGTMSNENEIINRLKSDINAYWNGFDATGASVQGGVSIHHPSGDVKKISFFTGQLMSTGYNYNGLQSHWQVTWSNGVTEGGSSGSPIFNNSKNIVGTLSGGSSYCYAQTSPDLYGKMSYHWDQNIAQGSDDLKDYLNPNGIGGKVINGSYDPCEEGGTNPNPDPEPGDNPNPGNDDNCEAGTQVCDEYIAQVMVNTLNNETNCDNYSYYTNPTTTLQRGKQYEIGVVPGVLPSAQNPNAGAGSYYTGDIIAAWIDFNGDGQFSNNERIHYDELSQNSDLTSIFTVPNNATTGKVTLRVRIDYQQIDPCGISDWGEVEDYEITIEVADEGGVGVQDEVLGEMNVFPNPAHDVLTIDQVGGENGNYSIDVFDLTGKRVLNSNTNQLNGMKLNISNLASGMYQLRVHKDGHSRHFKFIKE